MRTLPPVSRRALGTGLVVFSLAATLLALVIPVALFGGAEPAAATARTTWSDDGGGVTATNSGPLTPWTGTSSAGSGWPGCGRSPRGDWPRSAAPPTPCGWPGTTSWTATPSWTGGPSTWAAPWA
ncbi:hypothetical protein ACFQ2B_31355 [Streptomyces stramineus]